MNQSVKSRPAAPVGGMPEAADSDWGLNAPQKRVRTNTRIGVLLVVCLVGAVCYVTYRKLDERRRDHRSSDFHHQVSAAQQAESETPPSSSAPNDPLSGSAATWAAGPGNGPTVADDVGPHATPADLNGFLSAPPEQQEPSESPPSRTYADDRATDFLNARNPADTHLQSATDPTPDSPGWNPFASESSLESPEQDHAPVRQEASASGTANHTDSKPQFDWTAAAASGRSEDENTWSQDQQGMIGAAVDTPETPEQDLAAVEPAVSESPSEPVMALFGGDSQPDEEAAQVAHDRITAEPGAGPLLEPLRVPADDARVMPVASDGTSGDFTQRAAAEASDNAWTSAAPRELAQNSGAAAVEFDLGEASSAPAEITAVPSSTPAFLPESSPPSGPGDAWNRLSPGAGPATTTNSDPFSQYTAPGGATQSGADGIAIHTVQSGDNFWTIAHRYYQAGRYANALAAFNQSRIPDPRKMRPGMKVLVPDEQVLVQQFPKLTGAAYGPGPSAEAAQPGFFVDRNGQPAYRVGKGDTLTKIAARHLGRPSRSGQILGMNRDQLKDANSLKIGMVLKLPRDATQVSVVLGTAIAR